MKSVKLKSAESTLVVGYSLYPVVQVKIDVWMSQLLKIVSNMCTTVIKADSEMTSDIPTQLI